MRIFFPSRKMLHDMLMFTSNILLLLYENKLRELVYLTRCTTLSISRKFQICLHLHCFLSQPIVFSCGFKQKKKTYFNFFCVHSAKISSSKHT